MDEKTGGPKARKHDDADYLPLPRHVVTSLLRGATPSTLSVVRGILTGYEADAELIYVTGREEMQAVDHAVVTAHE